MKNLSQSSPDRQPIENIHGIQPGPIVEWYLDTLEPAAANALRETINRCGIAGIEFFEDYATSRYKSLNPCPACGMPCWRGDIPAELLAIP